MRLGVVLSTSPRKLAAQDQGNAQAQRDLSVSLEKVGDVKLQGSDVSTAGDAQQARAAVTEALAMSEKLEREQKFEGA